MDQTLERVQFGILLIVVIAPENKKQTIADFNEFSKDIDSKVSKTNKKEKKIEFDFDFDFDESALSAAEYTPVPKKPKAMPSVLIPSKYVSIDSTTPIASEYHASFTLKHTEAKKGWSSKSATNSWRVYMPTAV